MTPRQTVASLVAGGTLSLPGVFAADPAVAAIPVRALEAYLVAAAGAPCELDWRDLAGVGAVETGHGTSGGSVLDAEGRTTKTIVSSAGARGPMQFMPGTWEEYGAGGDVDDVDDAAAATARKLCADGITRDRLNALGAYNGGGNWRRYGESLAYVKAVDAVAASLPELDPQAVGTVSATKDRRLGPLVERLWDRLVVRGWLALPDRFLPGPVWERVDNAAFGGGPTLTAGKTGGFADTWPGPGLQPGFQERLDRMFAAAPGTITVYSGWRDPMTQKALWDASDKTGTWVAFSDGTNCTSMHCRGLAADLTYENQATQRWALDHAADFGLEVPMDWEPWHIQPADIR